MPPSTNPLHTVARGVEHMGVHAAVRAIVHTVMYTVVADFGGGSASERGAITSNVLQCRSDKFARMGRACNTVVERSLKTIRNHGPARACTTAVTSDEEARRNIPLS